MAVFPRSDEPQDGLEVSNVINPNDHGAYITIALALCLTCSFLFYIFRLTTRWPFRTLFRWDDAACTLATLLGLGQAIAISSSINSGLGQHESNLSEEARRQTFKQFWISNIMYIFTLCLGRMADSLLIYRLTRTNRHIVAALTVTGVIALWGLISASLVGTWCNNFTDLPAYHTCMKDSEPRWIGIAAAGFVLEIVLLILPGYLVWSLQAPLSTKLLVVMAFWFRIPVSVLGGLRIDALIRSFHTQDLTFLLVRTEVYTQIELHLCIICATVPCMRPFLRVFNTGFLATLPDQMGPHKSSYARDSKIGSALKSITSGIGKEKSDDKGKEPIHLGPLRPDHADTVNLIECRKPSTVADVDTLSEHDSDRIMVRKTVRVSVE